MFSSFILSVYFHFPRQILASVWGVFLLSFILSKFLNKMASLPPCLPTTVFSLPPSHPPLSSYLDSSPLLSSLLLFVPPTLPSLIFPFLPNSKAIHQKTNLGNSYYLFDNLSLPDCLSPFEIAVVYFLSLCIVIPLSFFSEISFFKKFYILKKAFNFVI